MKVTKEERISGRIGNKREDPRESKSRKMKREEGRVKEHWELGVTLGV
jgi:hypothetical protein